MNVLFLNGDRRAVSTNLRQACPNLLGGGVGSVSYRIVAISIWIGLDWVRSSHYLLGQAKEDLISASVRTPREADEKKNHCGHAWTVLIMSCWTDLRSDRNNDCHCSASIHHDALLVGFRLVVHQSQPSSYWNRHFYHHK